MNLKTANLYRVGWLNVACIVASVVFFFVDMKER